MKYQIIQGDNAHTLKQYPDNHFDAIVTDPPYGIEFLNKEWDNNTGTVETWSECLRVLKPGGHLLAFSAARTYHRLATNLETVGFEIRDQLMWIYSSGFPKAQDVGKNIHKRIHNESSYTIPEEDIEKLVKIGGDLYQHPDGYQVRCLPNTKGSGAADQYGGNAWNKTYERVVQADSQWAGWKTALKPAHEPIVMSRKPFTGSTVDNVQQWGTGALNIDACRIGDFVATLPSTGTNVIHRELEGQDEPNATTGIPNSVGRFPSNVLGDIPDYQKYFYCPKVSRKERHIGHQMPPAMFGDKQGAYDDNGQRYAVELDKRTGNVGNNHPTVKPVALMRYLIQLVTPPGGHVLDPFAGSGSTGMAAVELGMQFTGCELDPDYVKIAQTRIEAWNKSLLDTEFFNETQ